MVKIERNRILSGPFSIEVYSFLSGSIFLMSTRLAKISIGSPPGNIKLILMNFQINNYTYKLTHFAFLDPMPKCLNAIPTKMVI